MATADQFPTIAQVAGDLDVDIESIETDHQEEDQYIQDSQEMHRGGIKMKIIGLSYLKEEECNPYIRCVNAAILKDDDSTTDEMQ